MAELKVTLKDEAATLQAGQDIALALTAGDCILLSGDLGAGKTTLARAVIRHLADNDELEVPSPTFTLVQPYDLDTPVAHFDFYRLTDPEELNELGFEEAMEAGIVLAEWPQKAEGKLPKTAVVLHLQEPDSGEGRTLEIKWSDGTLPDTGERIARSLGIRRFLSENGFLDVVRRPLTGDASTRAYEHFEHDGKTHLLMNSPRRPDGPIIKDGRPYSQIAHLAEDIVPFIAIDELLTANGFHAPAIKARDIKAGLLVSDFMGNDTLLDNEKNPSDERYLAAAEMLAEFHQRDWPQSVTLAEGITHHIPPYDLESIMIEVALLLEWYAPEQIKSEVSPGQRGEFNAIWQDLYAILDASEKSLVLRDFHSPNILWCGSLAGVARIGLIDFQDALIGPSAYDVASLAQDARVDISESLEARIVNHYIEKRQQMAKPFDADAFRQAYAIMAAQRATKILGIFIRLSKRDGKDGYLVHLPRMEAYIQRSLNHPVLARYKEWMAGFMPADRAA